MMVEEKKKTGVGPSGWGWSFGLLLALPLSGLGVGPLGWGSSFLLRVGPSFSGLKLALRSGVGLWVGVGPPFLGLGLAVTSFGQGLASGVDPSLRVRVCPFLLAVGVAPSGQGWPFMSCACAWPAFCGNKKQTITNKNPFL